jgi:hypothetical protein
MVNHIKPKRSERLKNDELKQDKEEVKQKEIEK